MYYVYIIGNQYGRHYIGVTSDVGERLKKHNHHSSRWTKHKGPWRLLHKEEFQNKSQALSRERKIKDYKGGNAFKELIGDSPAGT